MSNITKQGNLITTEIYETDAVVEDGNLLKYAINDNIKIRIANDFVVCNEIWQDIACGGYH